MSPPAAGGAIVFLFASLCEPGRGKAEKAARKEDEWAQAERVPASQRLCAHSSSGLLDDP
eukprot:7869521-Pyramimonas_sp.AAC.1